MCEGADERLLGAVEAAALVEARVYPTTVKFRHQGKQIASHERCYGRLQKIFDLEHYLDVLERKPGAVASPGRWPTSYDRIWEQMIERQERQPDTRAIVELIRIGREFGYGKLTTAAEQALELGCGDVAAVRQRGRFVLPHLLLSRPDNSSPCLHKHTQPPLDHCFDAPPKVLI